MTATEPLSGHTMNAQPEIVRTDFRVFPFSQTGQLGRTEERVEMFEFKVPAGAERLSADGDEVVAGQVVLRFWPSGVEGVGRVVDVPAPFAGTFVAVRGRFFVSAKEA